MAPRPRSELQEILDSFVPEGNRAYFQPPENRQMVYPCILYGRSTVQFEHADNSPYAKRNRWTITVIDPDPESPMLAKVEALPTVSFDRHFVNDNLNHDVYTIFF